MSNIEPLLNKVLVLPDQVPTHSPGGIAFLDQDIEIKILGQTEGEVVKMDADAFKEWVNKPVVGDRIIFSRYAGQLCEDEGTKYRLVNDKDVVAIRRKP